MQRTECDTNNVMTKTRASIVCLHKIKCPHVATHKSDKFLKKYKVLLRSTECLRNTGDLSVCVWVFVNQVMLLSNKNTALRCCNGLVGYRSFGRTLTSKLLPFNSVFVRRMRNEFLLFLNLVYLFVYLFQLFAHVLVRRLAVVIFYFICGLTTVNSLSL